MSVDDLWYKRNPKTGKRDVPSTKHGRGKRWRVRVKGYPNESFAKKNEAVAKSAELEGERVAGILPSNPATSAAGAVLFREYATRVIDHKRKIDVIDESTHASYESALRLHVCPHIGDKPIGAIDARDVKALHVALLHTPTKTTGKPLGQSRAAYVWKIAKMIFIEAVTEGVRASNPMMGIAAPPRPKDGQSDMDDADPVKPWSADTVGRVLGQIDRRWQGPAAMSAALGLRPSESFAISLDDVDGDTIMIRHQSRPTGEGLKMPKGRKSRRVPLPSFARDVIRWNVETRGTRRLWCDCHKRWNDLVFVDDDGLLWNRHSYRRRVWDRAVHAAGIARPAAADSDAPAETGERPRLRLVTDDEPTSDGDAMNHRPGQHQLRHFYASDSIAAGISIAEVAKRLGHSDIKITYSVYQHLLAERDTQAAAHADRTMRGMPFASDYGDVGADVESS